MLLTSVPFSASSDVQALKSVIRTIATVSDVLLIPDDASRIPELLPLLPLARFWVVVPLSASPSSTSNADIISSIPLQLLDGGASRVVFQYRNTTIEKADRI